MARNRNGNEPASLMEHLISALDTASDGDVEELWLREAEQRYEAYRHGQLKPRPANQVFEEAARTISHAG